MNKDFRIDAERMRTTFDQLAQIGSTGDGGVNRPSLSEAHLAARAWFRKQIEGAGLEFRTDGAGNHSAFLACGPKGAPTLLLGSHLDSVVNGGRLDGALGVMAAFEVLRTVKEAGVKLDFNLEAIDFTDEEGTLVGLLGSGALAGSLDAGTLTNPRGGREQLLQGMQRAGLTEAGLLSAARSKTRLPATWNCTSSRANGWSGWAQISGWSRPSWASGPIGCPSSGAPTMPAQRPWKTAAMRRSAPVLSRWRRARSC